MKKGVLDTSHVCDCCNFEDPIGGLNPFKSDGKEHKLCDLCYRTAAGNLFLYRFDSPERKLASVITYSANLILKTVTEI